MWGIILKSLHTANVLPTGGGGGGLPPLPSVRHRYRLVIPQMLPVSVHRIFKVTVNVNPNIMEGLTKPQIHKQKRQPRPRQNDTLTCRQQYGQCQIFRARTPTHDGLWTLLNTAIIWPYSTTELTRHALSIAK